MGTIKIKLENCTNETLLTSVNVLLLLWYGPTLNILHLLDSKGGSATLAELSKDESIFTDTLKSDLQLLNNANLIGSSGNDTYELNSILILELLKTAETLRKYGKLPDEKHLLKQIKEILNFKN